MRTMTIAIPSYQRRDAVRRLVLGLAAQLADPSVADGVDLLVVLDGSTDGSRGVLEALDLPVPLTVLWQENAGLAAARNAAIEAATGELILFLDDDMVPSPHLLARHRRFHSDAAHGTELLMGPCLFPADLHVVALNRSWADDLYPRLARQGEVVDADDCSFANTSGPTRVFRQLGGFDARFVGWGGEDYEMGLRVLRAGIPIRYDHAAVAWHLQDRGVIEFCRSKLEQGRNMVRIAEIHPDAVESVFPSSGGFGRLARLRRVPQPVLLGLARASAYAAQLESRLARGRSSRLLYLAVEINLLAGVADLDPARRYVDRLLAAR